MEVLSSDHIEDLFRLALLFSGQRDAALELLVLALSEAQSRTTQWRTQRHRFLWTFRFLSELATKKNAGDGAVAEFGKLSELIRAARPRVRPALLLQSIGGGKSGEVAQLFGLRQGEMRLAWLRYREQSVEAGFEEAAVREAWHRISLSPEETSVLEKSVRPVKIRRRAADRFLALSAVFLGVCVLLVLAGWEYWRKTPDFLAGLRMREFLEVQRQQGPAGIEPFAGSLGAAQDWFFLHGMEDVTVPPPFASVSLRDVRILDWNGSPAACFYIQSPAGMLVVVEAGAIGLAGAFQESGRTRFEDWSGAWAVSGRYAVFLLVRSTEDVLASLLR